MRIAILYASAGHGHAKAAQAVEEGFLVNLEAESAFPLIEQIRADAARDEPCDMEIPCVFVLVIFFKQCDRHADAEGEAVHREPAVIFDLHEVEIFDKEILF